MIKELMQRSVVSDQSVATFCSTACYLAAAAILLLGFNRFEHFDFTVAQLYLATIGTLMLAAAFVGLALLIRRRPSVSAN